MTAETGAIRDTCGIRGGAKHMHCPLCALRQALFLPESRSAISTMNNYEALMASV